jgi:hypothetical protein
MDKLKNYISDPKTQIEYLLNISIIVASYFYIYVYQGILMFHFPVKFVDTGTLLQMSIIVVIVIPLVHFMFLSSDPLQRSHSKRKTIRFFQNEFPSNYLIKRCENCIEDANSCTNYLKRESGAYIGYWFRDIFHGYIEKQNPRIINETFSKGYTCKLVYYLSWVIGGLGFLGLLTIVIDWASAAYSDKIYKFDGWQIAFPVICFLAIGLIASLNKVDDKLPTGCWHAWRQINRQHISWMKDNESELIKVICLRGKGTKKYVRK